jgi:hypothetical protein
MNILKELYGISNQIERVLGYVMIDVHLDIDSLREQYGLTPDEFDLLKKLVFAAGGEVYARRQVVYNLKAKLNIPIQVRRGGGYRLDVRHIKKLLGDVSDDIVVEEHFTELE